MKGSESAYLIGISLSESQEPKIRKFICAQTGDQLIRIGWLSLQPDEAHSISFGLSDKTYISPRFRGRHMIWNLYNRITLKYEVESDPQALEPVRNPHFTFHPMMMFHLKSNADRAGKDESIFEGLMPIVMYLQQQRCVPWIRATSSPLNQMRVTGARLDSVPVENLVLKVPSPELSVQVALDFVRIEDVGTNDHASRWSYAWGDVALQLTAAFTYPRIATLAWSHSY